MGVTEPTDEMVKAAARRMAQLDLPDSHTLDDRLTVPWQRYKWEAEQVLEAVLSVVPSAPTEDDREAHVTPAGGEADPLVNVAQGWCPLCGGAGMVMEFEPTDCPNLDVHTALAALARRSSSPVETGERSPFDGPPNVDSWLPVTEEKK